MNTPHYQCTTILALQAPRRSTIYDLLNVCALRSLGKPLPHKFLTFQSEPPTPGRQLGQLEGPRHLSNNVRLLTFVLMFGVLQRWQIIVRSINGCIMIQGPLDHYQTQMLQGFLNGFMILEHNVRLFSHVRYPIQ